MGHAFLIRLCLFGQTVKAWPRPRTVKVATTQSRDAHAPLMFRPTIALRLFPSVLVFAAVLLSDGAASACGWWRLIDHGRNREVEFDVSYIRTKAKNSPAGAYMKPIAVVSGSYDSLTCSMRNQEAKISNGSAVSGKARIATTEADNWKIGQHDYQVAIVDRGEKFPVWRWHVTVTEGDVPIASGEAMSFACVYRSGALLLLEEEMQDVARQLMCYLIARDQAGMKLADMPWNRPVKRRKK
jgi:hypothetical protein